MANLDQMAHVAVSCSGYNSVGGNFIACIGSNQCKSCSNCTHFKNDKCDANLFDKVLTSLDQG